MAVATIALLPGTNSAGEDLPQAAPAEEPCGPLYRTPCALEMGKKRITIHFLVAITKPEVGYDLFSFLKHRKPFRGVRKVPQPYWMLGLPV